MMLAIVLTWSLTNACPLVNHYRGQGYSDAQIEEGARSRGAPEWLIRIAKRRCAKPLTSR